ncbi:MAG: sirohydrochlorin cobaltochelatase [Candidatus Methanomethylophilaceae archaeon]|jgi:sirohydrochlorin cobaltochelatase|nr:sirohydrochlorin cobaltochelatase [Candidatus Methanomethylophilaceae archaeon]
MKTIIITGFGSSSPSLRRRTFGPIVTDAEAMFPDAEVRIAFTGRDVIERIRSRGGEADSLEDALAKAASEGSEEAAVMPTLPIAGGQFRLVQDACSRFSGRIPVRLCGPLLSSREPISKFLDALPEIFPDAFEEGCALVMMGHGRGAEADGNLCMVQHMADVRGMDAFFVTATGTPSPGDAAELMRRAGVGKAVLAPLMFEAGFHARRDMAAEDGPVRSALESAGFDVECVMKGMGEIPEFR